MAPVLDSDNAMLMVIDVQERLAPAIADIDSLLSACQTLLRGAQLLSVPIVFTEHCPDRIGSTVANLRELATDATCVEKTWFGALRETGAGDRIESLGRRQVVVAGTETHVCVMQTALGLLEQGYQVFLVIDAIGSRRHQDKQVAVDRLCLAGATPVTTEMVLFEWLEHANADCFREMLGLVKGKGDNGAS